MATLTIGGKTVFTQSGTDEPVLSSDITGTLGSGIVFPAGHVIQVKQFIFSKIARTNSGSMVQITDGTVNFELDITPQFTNSKILMLANIQIGNTGQNGSHIDLYFKVGSDPYAQVTELLNTSSTNIGVNAAQGTLPIGSSGYERFNFAPQYLDESVNSLEQRFYSFYHRTGTSGYSTINHTPTAYSGSGNNDFGKSSSQMTLMEITA